MVRCEVEMNWNRAQRHVTIQFKLPKLDRSFTVVESLWQGTDAIGFMRGVKEELLSNGVDSVRTTHSNTLFFEEIDVS